MTESEQDPKVLQAYRALGDDAPPPALDAAILAAARRRGGRWRVPLAAAATLTLAAGVALLVQHETPRTREEVALAPQVIPAPAPAEKRERAADDRAVAKAASGAEPGAPAAARPAPLSESAARADRAPPPMAARSARAPEQERAAELAGAAVPPGFAGKDEPPEAWLKRIAELREAGREREADESLAAFRRRHPDYEIPEAMRARVLPR